MKPKSPVIGIRPDVQYMPPENYEQPELKIVIAPPDKFKYCPHDYIRVYPHHRLVQCTECGAKLDPFDHLVMVAQQEANALTTTRILKAQIKHLQEQEAKLKQQIAHLNRIKKSLEK